MKKNSLLRNMLFYSISILLLWLPYSSYAQAVKRQCISSYASFAEYNNVLAGQTAGQSYFTLSFSDNKSAVLQGFQQPVSYIVHSTESVPTLVDGFRIFPNPANYSFTIQSREEISSASVLVSDINGRNIVSEEIPSLTDHEIICETWESGIYFVTLYINNRNIQTQKIIILK